MESSNLVTAQKKVEQLQRELDNVRAEEQTIQTKIVIEDLKEELHAAHKEIERIINDSVEEAFDQQVELAMQRRATIA